jgi:hypothetical protein
MTLGAAALVAVVLSAGAAHAEPPAAPRPGPAAGARPEQPARIVPCTKYRGQAEKNELAKEEEVAGWANAALERSGLRDDGSVCFLHVRITAGPTSTGGKEDGWIAHVAVSTRRYLKEGKLVTNEKGMLLVDPRRDGVAARAQKFVEDCVAKLKAG